MIAALVLAALSAVMWRLRGGPIADLIPGITSPGSRAVYGLAVGAALGAFAGSAVTGAAAAAGLWMMLTVAGWGSYQQMGGNRTPDNEWAGPLLRITGLRRDAWAYDALGMAVCGAGMGIVLAAALGLAGALSGGPTGWKALASSLALPGLGAAVQSGAYAAASLFKGWRRWAWWIDGYTAVGEVLAGAGWGAALALVVLP